MRTSIYLSNRSISAVCCDGGSRQLTVSRCHKSELPWGLMMNGSIADIAGLTPHVKRFISELGGQLGKLTLVIDGDSMTGKVLDVPSLPPGKMRRLIANELTIDKPGDFLYDYSVVSSGQDSGGQIFALAAERAQIEPLAALFASAGTLLRGIDVSQSCAMRFFSCVPEYAGMTFICAFADGADIISMLFTDGKFSFVDRSQLIEQRGTPAAAVEISRVLSAMAQYDYMRKGQSPLSHAFISGLQGEEAQFYSEIGDALGLTVGPLADTAAVSFAQPKIGDWGPYLFCLGDLMS